MWKRIWFALCMVAFAILPAAATSTTTTTLSNSAYTSLGSGPLALSTQGGGLAYLVSDTQPANGAPGIPLLGGLPIPIQTNSQVWAVGITSGISAVVYPISGPTVNLAGSVGADYSANKPALPNVGSNFGSSGPYANYVLIATAAANPARSAIDIENISGAQIAVVRDDGTAAGGAAPANASVFALAGGVAAGAQGGAWSSQTFKGRLQIYALSSGAIVAVMGD